MDKKNTDPDVIQKIEQALNSYQEQLDSISDEEKPAYKPSPQQLLMSLAALKKMNEADQENSDAVDTESSLIEVEQEIIEKNKDAQAESSVAPEKTEYDSSTSVETEQSDD